MTKSPTTMKDFALIPHARLKEAILEMAKKLGIPGSISGYYDLYEAIFKEQEKAKETKKIMDELS